MGGGTVSRERLWRAAALGLLVALAWQLGSAALTPRHVVFEDRVAVPPPLEAAVSAEPVASGPLATTDPPTPPTAAPSPTPPLPVLRIGGTGGMGAYLRATPRLADRLRAWPDGTLMQPTGDEATADGRHWRQVRAPDGVVGWLPADFLTPAGE